MSRVRLEPGTSWSQVQHSTIEPLHSLLTGIHRLNNEKSSVGPDNVRIQKVLSEGVQLWQRFFFVWWGKEGSKDHYKRAIIGLPGKRHLNGILLACRWWPNIECWLVSFVILRGSGAVLLRNPIFLWFYRGVRTPCPLSPSLDPGMLISWLLRIIFNSNYLPLSGWS